MREQQKRRGKHCCDDRQIGSKLKGTVCNVESADGQSQTAYMRLEDAQCASCHGWITGIGPVQILIVGVFGKVTKVLYFCRGLKVI